MAIIHDYDALTGENKEKTITKAQLDVMLEGVENVSIEALMEQKRIALASKVSKLMALGLTEEEARA